MVFRSAACGFANPAGLECRDLDSAPLPGGPSPAVQAVTAHLQLVLSRCIIAGEEDVALLADVVVAPGDVDLPLPAEPHVVADGPQDRAATTAADRIFLQLDHAKHPTGAGMVYMSAVDKRGCF